MVVWHRRPGRRGAELLYQLHPTPPRHHQRNRPVQVVLPGTSAVSHPPPASERFTTNHRPPQNPPLQTCNASQHHRHRHLRLPPERSDDLSTHSLFLRQENRLYPLPLSFMAPNRRPTKKPHFGGALDQNPQDTLVNRVHGEPRSAFLYVLETRAVSLELLQFTDTWHIPRPRPPRAIFCSPRILRFFLVVFPHIPYLHVSRLEGAFSSTGQSTDELGGGAVRCIATILLVASKVLEGHNRELYSPRQPLLPTYDDERREPPPPYIYPQPNYLLHRSLWILFDSPVVCLLVLEPVSCVLTLNPQPLGIPSQHCRQRDTAEPPSNDFAIPISGSNDNDRLELNAPRSSPSSPSHTAHHVDLAATGRPLEGACHSPQGHFEPCLT